MKHRRKAVCTLLVTDPSTESLLGVTYDLPSLLIAMKFEVLNSSTYLFSCKITKRKPGSEFGTNVTKFQIIEDDERGGKKDL